MCGEPSSHTSAVYWGIPAADTVGMVLGVCGKCSEVRAVQALQLEYQGQLHFVEGKQSCAGLAATMLPCLPVEYAYS